MQATLKLPKIDLMKILSHFEQPLWLNCSQMDIKKVISIKCRWNTVVWVKIGHLKHFTQNLLGVKVHISCKISKFCWHFEATKTHVCKIFGVWIFSNKNQKSTLDHIIFIHKSYNEIVDKITFISLKTVQNEHFVF